jgi:DNA-binding NarL/FixJ family response regulator
MQLLERQPVMEKISVLIVDDHTLFRKGIRKMLEAEDDIQVIGEAATGQEALEQARLLYPDVILMDIKMPDMDGLQATRMLTREMPHIGIIFCTMFEDDEFIFAGLKAGGRGYILKESDPETMLRAIRAVSKHESLLSPPIARKVLQHFANIPDAGKERNISPWDGLTEREREVLALIGKGSSNKEIATQLSISEKTVKNHVANIFSKLHVCDRTQAVIYAIKQGLLKV